MRFKTNQFLILFFAVSFIYSCGKDQKKDQETIKETVAKEEWVQLFNGENLDNWIVKIKGHPLNDNYKNTFRAVDGVLQVNYDEYDTFDSSYGHIYYDKEFSDYRLRLEYRFTGDQLKDGAGWATRNSGVMLHCQDPETLGLDQDFPVSIEAQFLGGLSNGEARSTVNVCTPGTNIMMAGETLTMHCINSSSETYDGDQWVKVDILVRNDSIIKHMIDGEAVLTYYKPQIGGGSVSGLNKEKWNIKEGTPLKSGYISLQSESHPVEFRNIEILELN